MSNANLTKSQPFAATFRLSKLMRILASAVVLKLVLVASLFLDMPLTDPQAAPEAPVATRKRTNAESAAVNGKREGIPMRLENAVASKEAPRNRFRANLSGSMAYAAEPAEPGAAEPVSAPARNEDPLLREALQRKEADLDRREQELNNLQKDIENRLNDLKDMEVRLQVMLKEANVQKDQKMRHLVDVYTNMKPKQAGQVLETLDERTAVRILAGMRGRQAGEILTFVSPEKAAKLSEMLTRMQMPFE